jgi:hypothetical protein
MKVLSSRTCLKPAKELVELLAAEKGLEVVGQAGSVSDALASIDPRHFAA